MKKRIIHLLALKNASGYIRREIGQRINLRYNPQIIFELDDSINYGMHIEELIQKVKEQVNMTLTNMKKFILSAKKIGITYHVSPDGDAVGSVLALL